CALVRVQLRNPAPGGTAELDRDLRIPARLLHGRARFADRLRRPLLLERQRPEQDRPGIRRGRGRIGGSAMAYEVGRGGFLANLGKIYGGYTGGFIAFTIVLGILEQLGVPNKFIG